jgi:hypothetical protein
MTCNLLSSFLGGDLDSTGLFQTLFGQIVWYAIGTQRHSVSIPLKMGHVLRLDRSGFVAIFTHLDFDHTWVLIVYLLDH